ncbi:MAG: hypothetical protein ACRYFA_06130 [Janthinobacterium lividum]
MFYKGVIIGLDFDGTVVTHEFPEMGNDIPNCLETLKRITDQDGKLVLITMRSGKALAEAVAYLTYHKIPLFGVNNNPSQQSKSPKIFANIYIDDAALGCPLINSELSSNAYVDWEQVEKHLFPEEGESGIKSVLMEAPVYDDIPDTKTNKFFSFFTNVLSKLNLS